MKKDKNHQNRARQSRWRLLAQGAANFVAPNGIKATTVFVHEKHAVSATSIRKNTPIERIDTRFGREALFDFERHREACVAVGRHSPAALRFFQFARACDQRAEEDAA